MAEGIETAEQLERAVRRLMRVVLSQPVQERLE